MPVTASKPPVQYRSAMSMSVQFSSTLLPPPAAEAAATPYIMASVAPWASMFTEKGISSLKANMQPLSAVYNMRVNSSPSAVSTPFSMPYAVTMGRAVAYTTLAASGIPSGIIMFSLMDCRWVLSPQYEEVRISPCVHSNGTVGENVSVTASERPPARPHVRYVSSTSAITTPKSSAPRT